MLLPSLRATLLFLLLGCGLYPVVVTGLAQLLFPDEAEGSLLRADDGRVLGSRRLGQAFQGPGWLQGRPSATGYDPSTSGGSNLGMTSAKLAERRAADRAAWEAANPEAPGPVPEVLLTASGSGLDPDLPPEAARWQVPRIARARGVDPAPVRALLDEHVVGPDLGFLGEPRVNVLGFNLALERRFPAPR